MSWASREALPRAPKAAQDAWRARLGLESGGSGWGPPARLSPAAEMALLAIREMRSSLNTDIKTLELEIKNLLEKNGPDMGAGREWWKGTGGRAA